MGVSDWLPVDTCDRVSVEDGLLACEGDTACVSVVLGVIESVDVCVFVAVGVSPVETV